MRHDGPNENESHAKAPSLFDSFFSRAIDSGRGAAALSAKETETEAEALKRELAPARDLRGRSTVKRPIQAPVPTTRTIADLVNELGSVRSEVHSFPGLPPLPNADAFSLLIMNIDSATKHAAPNGLPRLPDGSLALMMPLIVATEARERSASRVLADAALDFEDALNSPRLSAAKAVVVAALKQYDEASFDRLMGAMTEVDEYRCLAQLRQLAMQSSRR